MSPQERKQRDLLHELFKASEPQRRVLRDLIRAEHRQRDRDADVLRGMVRKTFPTTPRKPGEYR